MLCRGEQKDATKRFKRSKTQTMTQRIRKIYTTNAVAIVYVGALQRKALKC